MRFAFDDEHVAFRDALRDLLSKQCTPGALRSAWRNDTGRVPGLWDRLVEIGLLDAELGAVDAVLALEETGRACAPEPVVEAWATRRADATLALEHTPYALYADSVAVVVAEDGGKLVRATPGVPQTSVDHSRRLFAVEPTGEVLDLDVEDVRDRAALAAAAQLVGLTGFMLELTVAYAADRKQFGVPIGSFQAVKHHLADAALALEFAKPLVYRAAWELENSTADASVAVSLAKASASDAANVASRKALQVHGAIGYAYEYDLHLWMKRAWALAEAWGDAAWHRDRIARAIGI